MAFKKAKDCGFCKENKIIDESTEEILDYLLRSKNFLTDITILKLNQKVSITLAGKVSEFIKDYFSPVKNSSIILFAVLSVTFISSHNTAIAMPNGLKEQLININRNSLVHLYSSKNITSEGLTNNLPDIKPGQPLIVIPGNLKIHTVKKGEKLISISSKYKVPLKKIISANPKFDLLNLKGGEKLIIPDYRTATERDYRYKLASRGFSPSIGFSQDRYFRWPVPRDHSIGSKFGFRGFHKHLGIDICGKFGDSIRASKSGLVTFSGWNGDYGQCIIIDHGYGIQTLYAHASQLLIRTGEYVNSGQEIAKIGITGRATGPHLHFQVMLNGTPRDPEVYLRS